MVYEGYQLKIGSLKLPCPDGYNITIVENGSYSLVRGKRIISDWQDANGDFHHETYNKNKATIRFTIKERSQEQQASLHELFDSSENIEVEYWDDYDQEYKTGLFYMDDIEAITSIATLSNIYYGSINITLTEY